MKNKVQKIEVQTRKIYLQFSTKKTKIIVFSIKRRIRKLKIKLNGSILEEVRFMKYLKITFYEKLKFDELMKEIKNKT